MSVDTEEIQLLTGGTAAFIGEQPMEEAVNGPMIRLWCEMAQDANPLYHDPAFARSRGYHDIVAPPTMLLAWVFEPIWRPPGRAVVRAQERDLPYIPSHPHGTVLTMTQTYRRLLQVGERPRLRYYRAEPTPEINTHRGRGVVSQQVVQLCDDDGIEVVRQDSVVLRFAQATPVEAERVPLPSGHRRVETSSPYHDPPWADLVPGTRLAPLAFPVPLKQFMIAVAATRDFYEVHHDDEYARSIGVPAMYIGTHFMQGLIGRYVTDWAGPDGLLRSFELVPRSRNHPGDVITIDAWVTRSSPGDAEVLVELAIICSNGREVTHQAEVALMLCKEAQAS